MQSLDSVNAILKETKSRMGKAVETTKADFAQVRTGRASSAIVENVFVDYYGSSTPLKQLANITCPEPRTIVIQPWDMTALPAIEKGIQMSELGLNPNNDGKLIRITVPELTEERRRELDKYIKKLSEEHRVSVRNVRREANDALKKLQKDSTITEDESRKAVDEVQRVTDENIKHIDELLKHKEKEIFEV